MNALKALKSKATELAASKASDFSSKIKGSSMVKLDNYLYNVNNSKPNNTKYYVAGGLAAVLLLVLIVVLSRPSTEKYINEDNGLSLINI